MRFPKLAAKGGGNYLRITLLAGLILLVFSGGVLTVFYFLERSGSKLARQEDSFYRILREYDISAGIFVGTEKEFEQLNDELDRLEKRAIGVETWLSVLKRRRALANRYPPSLPAYQASVLRALEAYPQSQPLAAFAAAAFVKDSGLNRETQERLRGLLPLLTDQAFNELRLSLHVILGDFKNPQAAAQIPGDLFSGGSEDIAVDLAVIKILKQDFQGAAAEIQGLLNLSRLPSVNSLRFSAEYYYDFGDPSRSAELFSRIDDDEALLRQADALYLAGFPDSARSIWSLLADAQNGTSLYNLAVTAETSQEAASYYNKLVNAPTRELSPAAANSLQFGLVRYSRLLDYPQAIQLLEKTGKLEPSVWPFIDLELCKRHSAWQESARQLAQAWLLLDRHPENEDLYHWAAWQMFFLRYSGEADILLRRTEQFQFSESWLPVYRALYMMENGDVDAAENLLRSIPAEETEWYIYANLGRINEARFSFARAVEYYEKAAQMTENTRAASRIMYRAAKCYAALGRPVDMLLALQYAVDMDPDNHSARLELDRTMMP